MNRLLDFLIPRAEGADRLELGRHKFVVEIPRDAKSGDAVSLLFVPRGQWAEIHQIKGIEIVHVGLKTIEQDHSFVEVDVTIHDGEPPRPHITPA